MAKKMQKGKFDLNDLADQLQQMPKMGGMGGIMGMMPGMGKMKDQMAAAGLDDKMFGRQIAIISSMTKAERANPDLLSTAARSASPPAPAPSRGDQQAPEDAPADGRHDEGHGRQGQGRRHDARHDGRPRLARWGLAACGGMMPAWAACPTCRRWTPSSSRRCRSRRRPPASAGMPRACPASGLGGGGLPGLPGGMKLPGLRRRRPARPRQEEVRATMTTKQADDVERAAACWPATAPRSTTSTRRSSTCWPSASAARRRSAC